VIDVTCFVTETLNVKFLNGWVVGGQHLLVMGGHSEWSIAMALRARNCRPAMALWGRALLAWVIGFSKFQLPRTRYDSDNGVSTLLT
jgi:hypothetical protein